MIRPARPGARRAGFTLIELGIVVTIMGIIVAFLVAAGAEGVRLAEVKATQGLMAKLDMAISDKVDALRSRAQGGVAINGAHRYLAAVKPPGASPPNEAAIWGIQSPNRARVIAEFDDLKAELPDAFVLSGDALYPLNFGGVPYPGPYPAGASARDAYMLPLGHMATAYRPGTYSTGAPPAPLFTGPGDNPSANAVQSDLWRARATGIYGASWAARAAMNKLLGYPPRGYDAADNDSNGLVDEFTASELGLAAGAFATLQTELTAKLANHTHKTARAECLYAILVEGQGPGGSMFSRDDFTNRQVGDTDNDGLPEFVDAWGEPIQFYRWPIEHPSGIQRGLDNYVNVYETREVNPLDPSNTLISPQWWSAQWNGLGGGSGAGGDYPTPSGNALLFMANFTSLVDPLYGTSIRAAGTLFDRTGATPRRAYYSRPLLVSAGPDKQLGIAQMGFDYSAYGVTAVVPVPDAISLNRIDGAASSLSPFRTSTVLQPPDTSNTAGMQIQAILTSSTESWGLDDIANQSLREAGSGL